MDRALYIAMTGAKHNMRAQALRSNNLANVNTVGFRQDFAQARSMGVYYGDGLPSRAYSKTENPGTDFTQGAMIETGRDLDIAIKGEGWLAVQLPDGSEGYTRAGQLQIDPLGQLVTSEGLSVLGEGGPIAIPPAAQVTIASDGAITIQPLGQGPGALAEVDRLKLVNPDPETLIKRPDGFIHLRDGEAAAADPLVQVESGFLESSNVNAVEELTQILSLARQYEMQVKLMKSVEDNAASASSILRMS